MAWVRGWLGTRAMARTRFGVGVSNHTIDQAITQRVAAMLAEFLRTFGARKDACRKRLKHWATVFCFIPSFIASSILLSTTGARQNGLQEKIVDMTLKHSRQRCLKH